MSKVALFLMGKKGFSVLEFLIINYRNMITDVVVAKDLGIDNDFYAEITDSCRRAGIMYHDREKSKFLVIDYIGYVIAIGWRWMLPIGSKVIIIHDSLLPKYRGFSPLVNYLINGEKTIGATALFADNNYDKGEIIYQSSKLIAYPIKIKDAIDLMCEIYITLSGMLINGILLNKKLESYSQNDADATYSLWRDDNDYWIDWSRDSKEIERFIDAVGSPFAGARSLISGTQATVNSARSISDVQITDRKNSIGKVIFSDDSYPVVVCGSGLLKIIDMTSATGEQLIPLSKFRTRFSNKSHD